MSNEAAAGHAGKGPGKALSIALWIVQVLLAAALGMAGFAKTSTPFEELAKNFPWTTAVAGPLVRFIGIAELAGALGLILPAATRILPGLTPLAAAGLATIQLLAVFFHLQRGEPPFFNLVLLALTAFVAWGRFKKAPIAPRG